ncbi:acetylglutamate semialdehyde dehydrogenase [Bacillus sp. FJAT-51639]|uniref:Acetylglutamate semialdehyde dehydrogenase n=1 Tax=Bacillus bruguierae TaxID=3127667 RepID=A0ABU8FHB4_9BACI
MENNRELSAKEYFLQCLKDKERVFKEITRLSQAEKETYIGLLENLKKVNKNRKDYSNKEIGKSLEDIVSFILNKSSVFEVKENIHTSSNEVDQLVLLNSTGKEFQREGYLDIRGEHFLSECKNYDGKIGVTWPGKFYSLLSVQSCKLGILFSYKGLTGTGWNDAVGLTKKLFLTRERIEDKIYIIEFNIQDFDDIANGLSFLEILEAKINALKTDTNFSHFITNHPAMIKA